MGPCGRPARVRGGVDGHGRAVQQQYGRRAGQGVQVGQGQAGVPYGAEGGPVVGGRGGVQGAFDPVDAVQRAGRLPGSGRDLGGGHRPHDERADRDDVGSGAVRGEERDPVGAVRGEPDAQRGGADGVHGDVGEGERHPGRALGAGFGERHGVQCGVQECGVELESGGLAGLGLGQCHLGVDVPAEPPGGGQGPERRPVAEAGAGEPLVEPVDRERRGAGRRPDRQVGRRGLRAGGREVSGGVRGPRLVGQRVLAAGVDADRAPSGLVGRAGDDLERDAAGGGDGERGLDGEFLQHRRADLLPGPQREFHHRGAGQDSGAEDYVVGEPGVGLEGEPAGEDAAVAVGEGQHGAEQRVLGARQPQACGVDRDQVRRRRPVLLVLEGVGGQVEPLGRVGGAERRPVHGGAGDVDPGQRGEERGDLVAVPALRGDARRRVRQVLGDHRGQHGVGAEFQVAPGTQGVERVDGVGEPDRAADLVDPVVGVAPLPHGDRTAGHAGDRGEGRFGEAERVHNGAELGEHRLHQPGVEGVAGPQPVRLPACVAGLVREAVDRGLRAGEHDRGRAVDRGDVEVVQSGFPYGVLGGLHGEHRAAGRQRLHQPAARDDQRGGVVQGEHPGGMGGRDLADGVAGDDLRLQAEAAHGLQQGDLDREQGRLGVAGPVQQVAVEHLPQRTVPRLPYEVPVDRGGDGVEGLGVPGEPLGEPPPHGEPLCALPGEQEGELAAGGLAGDQAGAGLADGEGGQAALQGVPVVGEHHGAVFQRGAPGRQRPAQVADRRLRPVLDKGVELPGLCAEGFGVPGGEHDGQWHGNRLPRLGLGRGRRFLDDHVDVGAADAERRDAGPAGGVPARPGAGLGQQLHRSGGPVDVRAGLVQVERPGHGLVAQRQYGLHHAGDARGGLGVADVRLDRAEPGRAAADAVLAVGGEDGLGLDRVAEGGAGAVCLDQLDVVDGQPGVGQGLPDDPLLGGAVRRGDAVAGAVLVDRAALDHAEDGVAEALCPGEPFQQHQADALGEPDAVGGGGERLAATVGGQAALPAELGERARGGHDGDAAGQRHRAFVGAQGLGGEVESDQRGGAGGVDRDRGAFQPECVGHPAGEDGRGGAGDEEAFGGLHGAADEPGVVLGVGADEHAGAAAAQRGRVHPGAFEHLPGGFEHLPLLRVHGQRLARADVEERRVERTGAVQEAALGGVSVGVLGVKVVGVVQVPAAVGGRAADGVGAGVHQPPQVVGGADPAWIAAAHRHDRDRLPVGGLGLAQPLTGLVQIRGDSLEIIEELALIHQLGPHQDRFARSAGERREGPPERCLDACRPGPKVGGPRGGGPPLARP
ncbi:hypothetical protein SNL152K_10895 [Streptomyces sp. NL15-2K]|nr:hypothetical protein SNL152K_10895 [Streptomyces sp. NL15-2K]